MNINEIDNNEIKNKTKIIHEMNMLDKLISTDCATSNELLNDFHKSEMKNNSKTEPTPVTIAAIKGGKKSMKRQT